MPSFAPHCISDGATRVVVGSVMRAAISGHRADELGVHGKLYAVKRQAAADDLDAPCIVDRPIDVHGGQCDVAPDTRPGFLADAGDGAFEGYNAREASTPEVEHAARWSPYASSAQRQEQLRGPSGGGPRASGAKAGRGSVSRVWQHYPTWARP